MINEIRSGVDIGTAIRNVMEGWRIYRMNGHSLVVYYDEDQDYIQIEKDGKCKSLRTLNDLEKDKIQRIASFIFEFNYEVYYEIVEGSFFSVDGANLTRSYGCLQFTALLQCFYCRHTGSLL